jgi:hypothetical protein
MVQVRPVFRGSAAAGETVRLNALSICRVAWRMGRAGLDVWALIGAKTLPIERLVRTLEWSRGCRAVKKIRAISAEMGGNARGKVVFLILFKVKRFLASKSRAKLKLSRSFGRDAASDRSAAYSRDYEIGSAIRDA